MTNFASHIPHPTKVHQVAIRALREQTDIYRLLIEGFWRLLIHEADVNLHLDCHRTAFGGLLFLVLADCYEYKLPNPFLPFP